MKSCNTIKHTNTQQKQTGFKFGVCSSDDAAVKGQQRWILIPCWFLMDINCSFFFFFARINSNQSVNVELVSYFPLQPPPLPCFPHMPLSFFYFFSTIKCLSRWLRVQQQQSWWGPSWRAHIRGLGSICLWMGRQLPIPRHLQLTEELVGASQVTRKQEEG